MIVPACNTIKIGEMMTWMIDVPADSLSYYINGEITTGIYANDTQLCNALAFDWTWCYSAGALPE
jgi:hypothetical protein